MNVAFIPVRGGSKSIPLKNIKPLCGKPLVYWVVKAACQCKYIDTVYVSTDNDKIKQTVNNFKDESEEFAKIHVIGRSAESATDTASTEYAMLEFADSYPFDNIVLIQATSPLLKASDLNGGFELYDTIGTDSVISVVHQYRFLWDQNLDGSIFPCNYDVFHRPRRQDFDGYLMENGAFYITSKENLQKSQNRVSGNIKAYEMSEDSAFEIDESSDWIIIEALMKKDFLKNTYNIPEIRMFLTDCDGCLTDAGMYYSEFGDELKKFNTRDGVAFSILKSHGIITGIITSEDVDLNRRRANKLGIDVMEAGCKDKVSAIKELCKKYEVGIKNVVYIGDDVSDIEAIKQVGFGCCPSDAMPQVKEIADYVAHTNGGKGVIREVVEMVIKE